MRTTRALSGHCKGPCKGIQRALHVHLACITRALHGKCMCAASLLRDSLSRNASAMHVYFDTLRVVVMVLIVVL